MYTFVIQLAQIEVLMYLNNFKTVIEITISHAGIMIIALLLLLNSPTLQLKFLLRWDNFHTKL